MWWQVLVGVAVTLVVLWLVLLGTMWVLRPDAARLTESIRLLPDVLRLVTRIARDSTVPVTVRIRLWLLLAYLASPIDLVPDFLPVIGYADDAIIVAATLRSVVRRAGPDCLDRHWPGTADGLAAVRALAGIGRD